MKSRTQNTSSELPMIPLVLLLGGGSFLVTSMILSPEAILPTAVQFITAGHRTAGDCQIKGNVSVHSGERIYHVPGQEYYQETQIRADRGERWFCTEQEARDAGWRKAKA